MLKCCYTFENEDLSAYPDNTIVKPHLGTPVLSSLAASVIGNGAEWGPVCTAGVRSVRYEAGH